MNDNTPTSRHSDEDESRGVVQMPNVRDFRYSKMWTPEGSLLRILVKSIILTIIMMMATRKIKTKNVYWKKI